MTALIRPVADARSSRPPEDPLLADLRSWPGQLVDSELERRASAHDASHYLLQPRAMVRPRSAEELGSLLRVLDRHGVGLTLRSGGTSLSGQAVTDQVLVDTRRHFRGVEVLDGGARVRVRPGSTVREVNAVLARHGRKLGPDPASESACTLGGVIADNSSGMHCGTEQNTYRTLESMVLITPSGTVLDTADPQADRQLREAEPELHEGLLRLRRRVVEDPRSRRTIERLFAMKNTMGYGLNSFLDETEPVRILQRLMIGSEGTLGFVAEAVLRTVEVFPQIATGLLVLPTLSEATAAVPGLVEIGSATVELMDATSLRVSQASGQAPALIMDIDVVDHAALLVEYHGSTPEELAERRAVAEAHFATLALQADPTLTSDPAARAGLWTVRKGLYAAVAGSRPQGANALLEDVVVPVERLGETCSRLGGLFDVHEYEQSVIFGHAKDGNVHFMLNEQFADPQKLARYERFTEEMVELVLGAGGSLKAEHGTGRIMAPYVRRQYGDELYEVMLELKRLVDPRGAFNPGVILNEDPRCHIQDLKVEPEVEAEVDRCVECGYCEPVCPSQDITLTPRQRIVGRREIAAATARGDHDGAAALLAEYVYEGEQTCAVDGMCATACPVDIDTGDLIRRLRAESASAVEDRGWDLAARGWGAGVAAASGALSAAHRLPSALPRAATAAARTVLGEDRVPLYSGALPGGGPHRPAPRHPQSPEAVFFPACVSSMFGTPDGEGPSSSEAFLALCERAGVEIDVPDGIAATCCGTPWKSKGMLSGHERMTGRTLPMLWAASDHGRLPVICDASSCTEGLMAMQRSAAQDPAHAGLRFVDAVAFTAERLLPLLRITRQQGTMALHPTCSSTQLGLDPALRRIASSIAREVTTPLSWRCCGYAGDRGMLHPELTAAATRREAAEVRGRVFDAYASLNRTCEQGLTEATGRPYRHVLQHLEAATR